MDPASRPGRAALSARSASFGVRCRRPHNGRRCRHRWGQGRSPAHGDAATPRSRLPCNLIAPMMRWSFWVGWIEVRARGRPAARRGRQVEIRQVCSRRTHAWRPGGRRSGRHPSSARTSAWLRRCACLATPIRRWWSRPRQIVFVGRHVFRPLQPRGRSSSACLSALPRRRGDAGRHLVDHGKQLLERPLDPVRPDEMPLRSLA